MTVWDAVIRRLDVSSGVGGCVCQFGGGPETSRAVFHPDGACRRSRSADTNHPGGLSADYNLKGDVLDVFTMKRGLCGLQLLHFLTLISGSPFQYSMFQGNAHSGAETRQRNK